MLCGQNGNTEGNGHATQHTPDEPVAHLVKYDKSKRRTSAPAAHKDVRSVRFRDTSEAADVSPSHYRTSLTYTPLLPFCVDSSTVLIKQRNCGGERKKK